MSMRSFAAKSATQISIPVEDVPGQLGRVMNALAAAGVTVLGICRTTAPFGNVVTERFVVDDVPLAKQALLSIGKRCTEEKIVTIYSPRNHTGTLAKAAKDLGAAGINIENFYYSALEKEKETNMYIQVSEKDFSKAVEVLQNI